MAKCSTSSEQPCALTSRPISRQLFARKSANHVPMLTCV